MKNSDFDQKKKLVMPQILCDFQKILNVKNYTYADFAKKCQIASLPELRNPIKNPPSE